MNLFDLIEKRSVDFKAHQSLDVVFVEMRPHDFAAVEKRHFREHVALDPSRRADTLESLPGRLGKVFVGLPGHEPAGTRVSFGEDEQAHDATESLGRSHAAVGQCLPASREHIVFLLGVGEFKTANSFGLFLEPLQGFLAPHVMPWAMASASSMRSRISRTSALVARVNPWPSGAKITGTWKFIAGMRCSCFRISA